MDRGSAAVARELAVNAVVEALDTPLGFDPTQDLLVPTREDEAERIVQAVLNALELVATHAVRGTYRLADGERRWRIECLCGEKAYAGTATGVARVHVTHQRSALGLS